MIGVSALFTQACAPPVTPQQVFARASRSVVMIHAAEPSGRITGRGSGVAIEADLFVTSCHVIARGTVFVAGYQRQRVSARLVAYDAERDICALRAQGLDLVPAAIGDPGAAQVGERVYAIGAPEGFELTMSDGLVSGLREAAVGRYLQITAPLSEGSSGGGLFDSEGRLIGITAFVFSAGQNLNFAAPANWAVDLAKKASRAETEGLAEEARLPPSLTQQWRHPVLR
ncbi:MAG: trypsin-like peptidase domain-containing protein [Burkholderiales bacterium]|nr:trypsin-like peptidase domain-containing protein [Burkholderiales bacterium]